MTQLKMITSDYNKYCKDFRDIFLSKNSTNQVNQDVDSTLVHCRVIRYYGKLAHEKIYIYDCSDTAFFILTQNRVYPQRIFR